MLELVQITAGYDDHVVLRDVSIAVPSGSIVALLGPNGAGKTTLLRVASGLLRALRGQVLLDGVDVTTHAPHQRAAAGLCHIPEGRGVFKTLTVRDNLRLHGDKQGRTNSPQENAAVAAFPRLGDRATQRAGTMSGGEQQMLALARAYVVSPQLILADEVSMGLAPAVVDEVYRHLRDLASGSTSLLLVEQYVERALALADYVYILDKGRVAFVGEPDELRGSAIAESYLGAASA